MNNEIKIGTILNYLTIILGNFISLVYTPFMISSLGKSEYGLLAIVNSIISYISMIDIGLGSSVIRYNSKYIAENRESELDSLNGMYLRLFLVLGGICFFIGIIFFCFSKKIFVNFSNYEISTIRILIILSSFNLFISFPLNIFSSYIISKEKFTFLKSMNLIKALLSPILSVMILTAGYKSIGLVIISIFLTVIFGLINVVYCKMKLKMKLSFGKIDVSLLKKIYKYSFFIFISSIAYQIYWSTDQFIIGIYFSALSVSIYSIGATFNTYFNSFANTISGVYLPKITKIAIQSDNNDNIMFELIKVGRIQCYICTFILSGFVIFGRQFINLWIGNDFNYSYYIALLLMIPQTISIIQSLFATYLEAINKHNIKAYIYLSVAIVNVLLSLILIKYYGIIGTAMGTFIGMFLNAVINNLYYYYGLKLDIINFWKNILNILCVSIIVSFISYMIVNNIVIDNYFKLLVMILFYTVILFLSFYLFSFTDYEKNIFKLKKL